MGFIRAMIAIVLFIAIVYIWGVSISSVIIAGLVFIIVAYPHKRGDAQEPPCTGGRR